MIKTNARPLSKAGLFRFAATSLGNGGEAGGHPNDRLWRIAVVREGYKMTEAV